MPVSILLRDSNPHCYHLIVVILTIILANNDSALCPWLYRPESFARRIIILALSPTNSPAGFNSVRYVLHPFSAM